jgi:hypothetical protein
MLHVALLAMALAGAPPPEQVAADDAVFWVQLPALGASMRRAERSTFAGLLPIILPRVVRRALAAAKKAELLATVTRQTGTGVDATVLLDAAGAAGPWRSATRRWLASRGFSGGQAARQDGLEIETLERGARRVALFSGGGRAGLSTDPARAAAALTPSAAPLARTASFAALVAASPGADLRARLEVQKLYGLLARQPGGPKIAGAVMRLGLDAVRAVDLHARLRDRKTLVTVATVHLPEPWHGLPEALGPAVPQIRPAEVPPDALSYTRVSLIPARIWFVGEKLCSFHAPLETTLARAQVDGIERQLGKTIVDDALGYEPRVWTAYRVLRGGRSDAVLVAQVADAGAARLLAESIAGLLPDLFAGIRVASERREGSTILTIQGIAFAFTDRHVVVASSTAAARAHLLHHGKPEPLAGPKVIAHGMHDDARGVGGLYDAARAVPAMHPWVRALTDGGVSRAALVGSLGRSSWQATAAPDGLEVRLTTAK